MGRNIKILLALLYLLQLPIIFRESVLELYKSATESLHRETQAVQVPEPTMLRRGRVHGMLPELILEDRDPRLDAYLLLGYAVFHHGDHHHLPEHENPDRPRDAHAHPWRERLIANLYQRIKRFAPCAERTDGQRSLQRLILFSAEA